MYLIPYSERPQPRDYELSLADCVLCNIGGCVLSPPANLIRRGTALPRPGYTISFSAGGRRVGGVACTGDADALTGRGG